MRVLHGLLAIAELMVLGVTPPESRSNSIVKPLSQS